MCAPQVQVTTPPVTVTASINNPASQSEDHTESEAKRKGRVGRPRTKPQKEKADWHYHLGGVRHSRWVVTLPLATYTCNLTTHYRTPLTPEIREVLEVAYVSRIMAKTFRKEGQPEKERIAKVTGLPLEKVCFQSSSKINIHSHYIRCKSGSRIVEKRISC